MVSCSPVKFGVIAIMKVEEMFLQNEEKVFASHDWLTPPLLVISKVQLHNKQSTVEKTFSVFPIK